MRAHATGSMTRCTNTEASTFRWPRWLWFLFCLYLGLYHGLFGFLLSLSVGPGRDNRRALAAAPFLWVAVELARARITGFPWNLLGTAQVDNISLSRITTWTGVYGVSFEIMLVNVAVAAAFLVPRKKRSTLLIASLVAAAVLQAGRLVDAPVIPADRAALLVQENIPVDATWTRDTFERTLHELTDLSTKTVASLPSPSADSKALDLIVWPESPAPFFTNDPLFRDPVSQMARETHNWVVTGAIGSRSAAQRGATASQVFNSAELIDPSGAWTARYDKVHLVPFGEYLPFPRLFAFAGGLTKEVGEFTPGASRTPPRRGRQEARNLHLLRVRISGRGAAVRETGCSSSGQSIERWLVWRQWRLRAAPEPDRACAPLRTTWLDFGRDEHRRDGFLIDPYGRTVARLPRKERGALIAPYSLTSVTTFYTRHGDWFAYLCAIISAGALLTRYGLFRTTGKKAEPSS